MTAANSSAVTEPTVIAHRGFAGVHPENTVAAVKGAVKAGADAVEIDVQPTADGDIVVFHDRRLDGAHGEPGLTDSEGVVWEQSTATVTGATVLETDETVPRLAAVLAAVPDSVRVNVELKNPGSDDIRPGAALNDAARGAARERWGPFVESVLAVTDRFEHDVLFSSFCAGALDALADLDRGSETAVLVAPNCAEAGETIARQFEVDAIHPPVAQCRAGHGWDRIATELDAACNVWTVTDWLDARAAVRAGADGIIADYPGLGTHAEG